LRQSKMENTAGLMKRQLVILIIFAISGIGRARAQSAIERLQPLVETSARRLAIAEQVAFAKWDSHAAVEDAPREKQVIMAAVKYGESRGLDRTLVSNVFAAQIEANKLVQYSLLADWHRAGRAPDHNAISLASIRRELDQLQIELIGELADTAAIRASATCKTDTAKAVGKYLVAHHDDRSVRGIALDRALAGVCVSE
jgi:chorismate mutase